MWLNTTKKIKKKPLTLLCDPSCHQRYLFCYDTFGFGYSSTECPTGSSSCDITRRQVYRRFERIPPPRRHALASMRNPPVQDPHAPRRDSPSPPISPPHHSFPALDEELVQLGASLLYPLQRLTLQLSRHLLGVLADAQRRLRLGSRRGNVRGRRHLAPRDLKSIYEIWKKILLYFGLNA